MAFCYWPRAHALLWVDPALEQRFAPLGHEHESISAEQLAARAAELGLEHYADACMRVLPPPAAAALERPAAPAGYRHEVLSDDSMGAVVERVRALTGQCSDEDVEEAALDELDEFDERAINVLVPEHAPAGAAPVAYASACLWDWDRGFGDIGVLVHPDHRARGLGRWTVVHTCVDLLDDGLPPLYRHQSTNVGSQAVADGLGFEIVTDLSVYALPSGG